MRSALRWLVRGLAAVGLVAILLTIWSLMPGEVHFGPPIVSPDGTHKAVLMTYRGGSGLVSYCYEKISVLDTDVPAEQGQSDDAIEFEGWCSRSPASANQASHNLKIEWVSADLLKIGFSIEATVMRAASVELRRQDESGAVRISFEVRD